MCDSTHERLAWTAVEHGVGQLSWSEILVMDMVSIFLTGAACTGRRDQMMAQAKIHSSGWLPRLRTCVGNPEGLS